VDFARIVAGELDAARRRSLDLLAPLPEPDLLRQISPIMSPLVWDLAHVGNYEELWLLRAATGAEPIDATLDSMYDAFRHPRPNRPALPLLGPDAARRYIGDVRGRVLDSLDRHPPDGDGFLYRMVIQHEHQHDETMLATLQLLGDEGHRPVAAPSPALAISSPGLPVEVLIPAGAFVMGTDDEPWAYDNEGPAHSVDLPAYWIDATPIANRAYAEFVADGGYADPRWWDDEGWAWRAEGGVTSPQFWQDEGGGSWSRVRFGWREDVPLDEPVQHVCWHEASAYARWAGKRLPTEAEWEKAASWGPDGVKRPYPWGDAAPSPEVANLGGDSWRPAPVGAYPAGASGWGIHQLVGDVWEWTSSEFEPYSGFESFPYREYSEVFFGAGYKVLRGGSWATSPTVARTTFRNWDLSVRRQIFAGFRCARDADA